MADDPLGILAEAAVRSLAEMLSSRDWDAPNLLFEVRTLTTDELNRQRAVLGDDRVVDVTGDPGFGDLPVVALGVEPPSEGYGHPFDLMVGHRVADEAVGAVLVTEGWMTVQDLDDTHPWAEAQRGPDGRTEVRMVSLALRDGTTATAVAARGGSIETIDTAEGRVIAALRRVAGAPSELTVDTPATMVERIALRSVLVIAQLARESQNLPEGVDPLDLAVASLMASEPVHRALPSPLGWLWDRVLGRPEVTWDALLSEMTAEPDHEAIAELVAPSAAGASSVLAWCDPEMFGFLFDQVVPDLAGLAEEAGPDLVTLVRSILWD